jgi:hypothetical protein
VAGLTALTTSPPAGDWQHLGNTAPSRRAAKLNNMAFEQHIYAHPQPCDRLLMDRADHR